MERTWLFSSMNDPPFPGASYSQMLLVSLFRFFFSHLLPRPLASSFVFPTYIFSIPVKICVWTSRTRLVSMANPLGHVFGEMYGNTTRLYGALVVPLFYFYLFIRIILLCYLFCHVHGRCTLSGWTCAIALLPFMKITVLAEQRSHEMS